MFGIGGWEFIVIAVLALLLFGPDKLPQFARTLGRLMRDFKRYQDLMESTIRAEVFANDPAAKDSFATGKEFRERVSGGGFRRRPAASGDDGAEESGESAGDGDDDSASGEPEAESESGTAPLTAAEATEEPAAAPGAGPAVAPGAGPIEGGGERD